ncbi:hypothetical protein BLS_009703 [Venturia inaequalis]|uniref:Fe2OG dioxygenase domain-containing protein n=1 Tax=Venturia inaequalis TaxID=5025 RepID=A0A8H3V4M5_VENIN|nr:hypothetical protein BLS_009703 [Venturia inaequalis]KAE9982379.1 hypothetical protein EG328_010913 [Venturia inaequalis]KAE9989819.1 hypothetical protein EG327_002207 [Venturia inaequalis]
MELKPGPQRGWIPYGIEKTSGLAKILEERPDYAFERVGDTSDLKDERESFDIGPAHDTLYPNSWPAAISEKRTEPLPGFQPFMETYFALCQGICLQIIMAVEIGLKVPAGTLLHRCANDASELRFNYYPSTTVQSIASGRAKRSWPHTDFGVLTLLFQDSVGGLELEDRTEPGTFMPITAAGPGQPSELIVNTAECLTRWTNDVLRAGLHQVVIPRHLRESGGETVIPDRYSCPFFLKAGYNVSVGPVKEFVSSEEQALYGDISALDYHRERVRVVYEGAIEGGSGRE